MKHFLTVLLFCLLSLRTLGQNNPTDKAQPIVEEGKRLFRSEMASWNGTDLFLEQYPNKENIGGYFSYAEGAQTKCIFFSRAEVPNVIGTVSFDSNFDLQKAKVDLTERGFTPHEEDILALRLVAMLEMSTDTMFKNYMKTNLNIIPLISETERKVYVLTGPEKAGVVIFGNDYLLTFDKKNKLTSKQQLHRNIIPIYYGQTNADAQDAENSIHNHSKETGDYITATDICTLMLYAKAAGWKTHAVVSKKYLNSWNCETNELTVIPMNVLEKIQKQEEKGQH